MLQYSLDIHSRMRLQSHHNTSMADNVDCTALFSSFQTQLGEIRELISGMAPVTALHR